MKLALSMIVKGDEKEAQQLKRSLKFIAPYVDKIFITITGGDNKKPVEEVCNLYEAEISYFQWCNDFGKARNFNFKQVPKEYEYIIWQDADDAIRGAEKIREVVDNNKDVDAFAFDYLYAFDEWRNPVVVHKKTRILRNDGCVEWEGALHEDFKENRELVVKFVKGIEWLHLSDEERFNSAKIRNLEVAKGQMMEYPNDPRSYWNVGNAAKAVGENQEAIDAFNKFLEISLSDDEKYIVRLRMGEIYWQMNEVGKAIDEARYGVGTKPMFPDAYFLLGCLYLESNRLEEAEAAFLEGLTKVAANKKAGTLESIYNRMIVFNPRDYDYTPLMNLAKVYFSMDRPDKALICLEGCLKVMPNDNSIKTLIKDIKKDVARMEKVLKKVKELSKLKSNKKLLEELEKLDIDVRSHPIVCNLRNIRVIKKKSSGKDLVIFCGFTAKRWDPEIAAKKGVGGSEEAVIHLSQQLADRGWNVTVYNNCGHKTKVFKDSTDMTDKVIDNGFKYWKQKDNRGRERACSTRYTYSPKYKNTGAVPKTCLDPGACVTYVPFWKWNYRDKQDVTILWRSFMLAKYEINSDKVFVDLHDVIPEGEISEERLKKVDKIFVKSKFHRSIFPQVPDDKFVIIPNGIVSKDFEGELKKDEKLLINTSSADRSLSALIKGVKKVRESIPDIKCKWAYGWDIYDVVHGDNPKAMEWKLNIRKGLKEAGIEELGMLNHSDVAKLYKKGTIFAYPSEFAEIDCISLTKALACGCVPVTTNFAALGEKIGYGGYFLPSKKTKDDWCDSYQNDFAIQDEEMINNWAKAVITELRNPTNKDTKKQMREYALNNYSWHHIGGLWNDELIK